MTLCRNSVENILVPVDGTALQCQSLMYDPASFIWKMGKIQWRASSLFQSILSRQCFMPTLRKVVSKHSQKNIYVIIVRSQIFFLLLNKKLTYKKALPSSMWCKVCNRKQFYLLYFYERLMLALTIKSFLPKQRLSAYFSVDLFLVLTSKAISRAQFFVAALLKSTLMPKYELLIAWVQHLTVWSLSKSYL